MDRIQLLRQLLDDRQKAITLALSARVRRYQDRLAALEPRLPAAARSFLQIRSTHLEAFDRQLQALSPQAVLNRGYTITTLKKSGEVLRDSKAARTGDRLLTQFADGQTESIVQDSRQMPLFE